MDKIYYCLYTHPHDSARWYVLHTGDGSVSATEQNVHLLEDMAKHLKEENIIGQYQIVGTC